MKIHLLYFLVEIAGLDSVNRTEAAAYAHRRGLVDTSGRVY